MRFRQLEYFVAVAEELHFGRAAKRLHMSQPPLSQQIRLLEEDLGVRLFERTSQRVALTKEGRYLLDEARGILGRIQSARSVLAAMGQGETGLLRLGYVDAIPMDALMNVMGRMHDVLPRVEISTNDQGTPDQFADLLAGRKDLGLVTSTAQILPRGLAWKPLLREYYVLAMPCNHPQANKPDLRLKDLNGERFLCCRPESNPAYTDHYDQAMHQAGLIETDSKSCCELFIKHSLVAQGGGLALLPSACMRHPLPGVVYHSLRDTFPAIEAAAAWHPERFSPIVEHFLILLEQELNVLGYSPDRLPD